MARSWIDKLVLLCFMLVLPRMALAALGTCTPAQVFTELTTGTPASEYATAYGLPGASKPITTNSTGNDAEVVKVLNAPRSGGAYQLNKGVVATNLLLKEMVEADLVALLSGTPAKFPILQMYMGQATLDTADTDVQGVFLDLFPAGTPSRTNLIAFFKREASPMEVNCGIGTVATDKDVSCAIRGAC